MNLTRTEIENNFNDFSGSWQTELPNAIALLESQRDDFLNSYSRIISLNAWRANVLEGRISNGSLEFLNEALNDAMVSHVNARFGSWRTALMSLRSCIENAAYCLYYKDHPVELRLWENGKHRPGFAEIHAYLKSHPDIASFEDSPVTGLATIKKEYGTLSRAVHASAKDFRMVVNGVFKTVLWKPDSISFAKWKTREQQTLCGVNLLLTVTFRDQLQGAQQLSLRKTLSLVIPTTLQARVRRELNVKIVAL